MKCTCIPRFFASAIILSGSSESSPDGTGSQVGAYGESRYSSRFGRQHRNVSTVSSRLPQTGRSRIRSYPSM